MREGVMTEEAVSAELDLMDQAIQEEMESHRATSYRDCFRGSNLRRTIVAVGVQVLQQAQGNSFTTTYLVLFLQQIGLSQPLLINIAKMCVNLGACILTFYLSDKIGRRYMLMTGSFFMAALMWTISGVSAWGGDLSDSAAQGLIAAILFYVSCYTGGPLWAIHTNLGSWNREHLQHRVGVLLCGQSQVRPAVVYHENRRSRRVNCSTIAEVSTTQLREKTIALATFTGFVVSLLITYINPFVQNEPGHLGPKVGMIYGSISLLAIVFVFFAVPEMKGRSLEELDELFHARVPAWKASSYVCTGVGSRITGIEVGNDQDVQANKKAIDGA